MPRKKPKLAITSPADKSIVALTDGKYLTPQPKANERAPAHRFLLVSGTAACAGPVDINNVTAKVSGEKWNTRFPSSDTGSLALHAQASGCGKATSGITLIDLRVLHPAENASLPLTAAPAMPVINADLEVAELLPARRQRRLQ